MTVYCYQVCRGTDCDIECELVSTALASEAAAMPTEDSTDPDL